MALTCEELEPINRYEQIKKGTWVHFNTNNRDFGYLIIAKTNGRPKEVITLHWSNEDESTHVMPSPSIQVWRMSDFRDGPLKERAHVHEEFPW
jgi:hypothetical protein